jgi:predicted RNA-binding Zn ribbon-like protein
MDAIISQAQAGFEFIGGSVCLDFVNTVHGIREGFSYEGLTSYADLISWSRQADLLTASEAEVLGRRAQRDEGEARLTLGRAYLLREAIYHIFTALIAGTQLASTDLEALNRELKRGTIGASIILTTDGLRWEWRQEEGSLDQMLGPLARSAALLLMSAKSKLVRQCANTQCGWLFVDETKNHRRQYCRTNICGNKIRVRRHRQRQRNASTSDMEE